MGEERNLMRAEPVDAHQGPVIAAISREIVGIHARYFGRGPTKAKTVWRNDVVVCLLENVFTKAEQLLVDGDHFEQVRSHRQAFQDQVEPLLRNVVEQATGHTVLAFLSQVSPEGVASEVFTLGEALPERATADDLV
jgi:uncharacterized protein YbcI